MKTADLSGSRLYRTDYDDMRITNEYCKDNFELGGFMLPGSTCNNEAGRKQEYSPTLISFLQKN